MHVRLDDRCAASLVSPAFDHRAQVVAGDGGALPMGRGGRSPAFSSRVSSGDMRGHGPGHPPGRSIAGVGQCRQAATTTGIESRGLPSIRLPMSLSNHSYTS